MVLVGRFPLWYIVVVNILVQFVQWIGELQTYVSVIKDYRRLEHRWYTIRSDSNKVQDSQIRISHLQYNSTVYSSNEEVDELYAITVG